MYAPAFEQKTGMSRNRFDDIWYALVFRDQGDSVDGESSIEYRWRLVADFVEAINSHRAANYTPSDSSAVTKEYLGVTGMVAHGLNRAFHNISQSIVNLSLVARCRMQLAGGVE
jgi:hypothetical protein